eukprot:gnl/TRDRNA2_/TRDRNA2_215496_c0_seq1.p1 gnl/TRDRNA2_/TRDRNA2_215496_c0~~gnl/TRDRNA2_/TRDRNA2_215496_c0_seq1.p1  ORF type:complete len:171 (-),score=9.33 gnl/TRDRNA2_/TRDRNA2_215496_c0_seq1:4-444(-)
MSSLALRLAGNNYISFRSMLYATLDFADPRGIEVATQEEFLPLPEGWSLAQNTQDVVTHVIAKYPWSTHVMIVSDGKSFNTSNYHPPGKQYTMSFAHEGARYKPTGASGRILIACSFAWSPSTQCVSMGAGLWQHRQFADCTIVLG